MARTTRYRFRTPSDRKLLESILAHKPYAAPYGSKAAKWGLICADLSAFELSNAQYRETKAGQLTARACRNRYKILKVDYPLRYGKYCTAEQKEVLALLDLLQYETGDSSSGSVASSVMPSFVVPESVGNGNLNQNEFGNPKQNAFENPNQLNQRKKKTAMEFILNSTPSDDSIDEEDGDTTSNDSHDCLLPLVSSSVSTIPRSIRSTSSTSTSSSSSSVYSNYENYIQEEDELEETLSLQDVLREFKALRQTVTTLIETKKQLYRHEHAAVMQFPSYPDSSMKPRMMIPQLHQDLPSYLHLSTARTTSSLSGHRDVQ